MKFGQIRSIEMTHNLKKSRRLIMGILLLGCQITIAESTFGMDDSIYDEELRRVLALSLRDMGAPARAPVHVSYERNSREIEEQIQYDEAMALSLQDVPVSTHVPVYVSYEHNSREIKKQIESDRAIGLLLGDAYNDFSNTINYDREYKAQEKQFSELFMNVSSAMEAREGDIARCLISSFLEIKNLHPLLSLQAQDMHVAVTTGKVLQSSEPKLAEKKPGISVVVPSMAVSVVKLPEGAGAKFSAEVLQLFELTNQERLKHMLPVFKMSFKLMEAAQGHSGTMARLQEYGHEVQGTMVDRIKAVGYNYRCAGENIAWSKGHSPDKVHGIIVQGWMESPGHRQNLLNPAFTDLGVGIATDVTGKIYWTQNFAAGE